MEQNHLTTEIISFFQTIFQNIDEFEKELVKLKRQNEDITELLADFDGSIESIIFCDTFWDNLILQIIRRRYFFIKIRSYDFTLIEKTNEVIQTFLPPQIYFTFLHVEFNIIEYIIHYWNERLKEPVKLWVQTEYGICPK